MQRAESGYLIASAVASRLPAVFTEKSRSKRAAGSVSALDLKLIYSIEPENAAVSVEIHQPSPRGDVTELLLAWSEGKHSALEQLVPLMCPELRRLARRCIRGEREGHTLQTSALVNEVSIYA